MSRDGSDQPLKRAFENVFHFTQVSLWNVLKLKMQVCECVNEQLGRRGGDRSRVIPAKPLRWGTEAETGRNKRPVFH